MLADALVDDIDPISWQLAYHNEETTLAAAGNNLPGLHLEMVPGRSRTRQFEHTSGFAIAAGRQRWNAVDEFDACLLEPAQNFSEDMSGLVGVKILVGKPSALLLFAHGHRTKVRINPFSRPTCHME